MTEGFGQPKPIPIPLGFHHKQQTQAEVAELADALGSGPSGLTMPVEVQVLSSAFKKDLRRKT